MGEKKKGLGRGLNELLPSTEWLKSEPVEVFYCAVDRLVPNPYQPRQEIRSDDASFQELVDSIRRNGVLQPVLVTRNAEGDLYQIVAGERRWQAARAAGLTEIPVIVTEASPRKCLELALVENIQRRDLNCIEEAMAYQRLRDEFGLTQEDIARRVGKKRASVANTLRLLQLPRIIQEDLLNARMTMGHARALLALPSEKDQMEIRNRILTQGWSVRQTEACIRRKQRPARPRPQEGNEWADLEKALSNRLQTSVSVRRRGNKGVISISFQDEEDLRRLLRRLGLDASMVDREGSA